MMKNLKPCHKLRDFILTSFCFALATTFIHPQSFDYSSSVSANSSLSTMQILIPKNPYVGDECELKYVFRTDADLFNDSLAGQKTESLKLSTDWPVFNALSESCLVQSAVLEHLGFEYTLTIRFIPWKSGEIDFKAFDLATLVRFSQNRQSSGASYSIDISPFAINSLTQKLGVTSLRPSKGPMVIPGTTFILILLALAFFVAVGLLFYFILKLPFIFLYFVSTRELRKIKKLFKKTERRFNKLLKSKKDDENFCQTLCEEIRGYLCNRFDSSFAVIATSAIYQKFEDFTCGTLSESQEKAVGELVEVLHRCDYIRFARGSIDSLRKPASLYEPVLGEGERKLLVNRALNAVHIFSVEQEEV